MSFAGRVDIHDLWRPHSSLYVPVLKGRAGEFAALEMMNSFTRGRSYPLIEIVPDVEIKPHEPHMLMKRFHQLGLCWAGPVMVDGSHLTDRETAGASGLRTVMDAARATFRLAVPVVRLRDGELVRNDASEALRQDRNGVAVRIQRDDMLAIPGAVARDLEDLLRAMGVDPEVVDLVLDLGHLRDDAAAMHASRLVDQVLSEVIHLERYRTVVLASGAFPPDLRGVYPWTLTEKSRVDAAAYEYLRARHPIRLPVYGDYAVTHPVRMAPPSGFPSPQLRYTVASRWLVLRGTQASPQGNSQFYDICRRISEHPEFSGPDLGQADQRIADPLRAGPGAASTWRALGTAHHADFVVESLHRVGLP